MRRSLLPILILLCCLLLPGCISNNSSSTEPPPPWKLKQIKLVNDYFDRYAKRGKLDEFFCEIRPMPDFGEVKSWKILDDREVSQQLGKIVVKLSKSATFNEKDDKDSLLCEVTMFRVTEFEEEYCIHKIIETTPEPEEKQEQ
jgi:hypothetical protein